MVNRSTLDHRNPGIDSPGPGANESDIRGSSFRRAAAFSFGRRYVKKLDLDTPGPSSYVYPAQTARKHSPTVKIGTGP